MSDIKVLHQITNEWEYLQEIASTVSSISPSVEDENGKIKCVYCLVENKGTLSYEDHWAKCPYRMAVEYFVNKKKGIK